MSTPGRNKLIAKYGADEVQRVTDGIGALLVNAAQRGIMPNGVEFALAIWGYGRSPVNAVTMYETNPAAVADEVMREYDKMLDMLSFYDAPRSRQGIKDMYKEMQAVKEAPEFRVYVERYLRILMLSVRGIKDN